MAVKRKKSGPYITTLRNFGGLDLSGAKFDSVPRFSRLENMWRDYHVGQGDAIETFPGYRVITCLAGAVHGIWRWQRGEEDLLLVHAGNTLYYCDFALTDADTLAHSMRVATNHDDILNDAPSQAFASGDHIYLLDGTHYLVGTRDVGADMLDLYRVEDLYIPITYSDGKPYEARNLLSRFSLNRYHIGDPSSYSYGSSGLKYRILNREERTCEVAGYLPGAVKSSQLYIPAETIIGGHTYRVVRVAWKAFPSSNHLKEVYISEGVEEIGVVAFDDCPLLETVYLPDSVTYISRRTFSNCPNLTTLVLGGGLKTVMQDVLRGSTLANLFYHGTKEEFNEIAVHESNAVFSAAPITYMDTYPIEVCRFPLYESISAVEEVTLDGEFVSQDTGSIHYTIDVSASGAVRGIVLHADVRDILTEKELLIKLRLAEENLSATTGETDFAAANNSYRGTMYDALAQCTRAACYDGRIFFAGNPRLPATVFYTARDLAGTQNPAYIGIYNYFLCGNQANPVTALLPTASYLAVLCGDDHGGSITYYHGEDTGRDLVPRIYVSDDSVSASGCCGAATLFRDDPVFLSYEGLEAVGREALNTERSLKHRSSLIDSALLAHDPKTAMCTVWEGYLVLLFPDGEAFLADSRRTCHTSRGTEYEWYHLSGIGAYTRDVAVFRHAAVFPRGDDETVLFAGEELPLELHPDADALPFGCTEEDYINSLYRLTENISSSGEKVVFAPERINGKIHLYLLYETPQRIGGTYAPPTALGTVGEKLFIGFENGCLAVVNTDRRGVMNDAQKDAYTPEAYAKQWGRLINPEWYTYAGHAYLAGLATMPDDCDVANYTKGTLRGSTVLEMKGGIDSGFSIEVRLFRTNGVDCGEILSTRSGGINFTTLDFGRINFGVCEDHTVVLSERSRRYVKKQYCLFSSAFAQPFGLKSLSYTWQVEGKVKNS